jgi:iron complex transport system permease protein
VAVLLVLGVARAVAGRADTRTLLMSGVVVGAFANAAIMIVLAGASEQAVRGALWWMMGSVGAADWRSAAMVWGYVLVGGAALFAWGRALDAIALGEEFAASVGVRVDRLVPRLFLVAALVAAATVAGAGLIGFVGLIVPAVARALGARGTRAQLVAAALAGATLVIGADVIARTVRAPLELPLGAVTALIGVPFFLLRLRRAAAA